MAGFLKRYLSDGLFFSHLNGDPIVCRGTAPAVLSTSQARLQAREHAVLTFEAPEAVLGVFGESTQF